MLNWSGSPSFLNRTVFEIDPKREQLEKLVFDLKAQVSNLKEQLASCGVKLQSEN
jgi:hypothetical protein